MRGTCDLRKPDGRAHRDRPFGTHAGSGSSGGNMRSDNGAEDDASSTAAQYGHGTGSETSVRQLGRWWIMNDMEAQLPTGLFFYYQGFF